MSAPVLVTAGDSTPNRLWTPEVNTGTVAAPVWTPFQYVQNCDFNPDDAALVDATIFGDGGFSGQDKLGAAWSLTLTVARQIVANSAPPSYDPAQEYVRQKAIGQFGRANRVQLRIYEFDINDIAGVVTPRVEAYMGYATCGWPGTGSGGQAEAREVAISFMGKGRLNIIAHPYPVAASVPQIYSITPGTLAVAGGTAVRILGSGFTGTIATTGVKFGGTNATNWTVVADNEIVATAPAHTAGSGLPVQVTNAVGSSAANTLVTYV